MGCEWFTSCRQTGFMMSDGADRSMSMLVWNAAAAAAAMVVR